MAWPNSKLKMMESRRRKKKRQKERKDEKGQKEKNERNGKKIEEERIGISDWLKYSSKIIIIAHFVCKSVAKLKI